MESTICRFIDHGRHAALRIPGPPPDAPRRLTRQRLLPRKLVVAFSA
jgi:hypothetical protein